MIKEEIGSMVTKAVVTLQNRGVFLRDISISSSIEHPEEEGHGDYSSNVALVLGQKLARNPREVADLIAKEIVLTKDIETIEVAGPGFLNFFVSKEYLFSALQEITKKKDEYGKNSTQKRKKIMVEFTDPNPFKEFHIGHLYSNIVGESLSRLLGASGATVKRANYYGDVGMHVAKAIWGMMKKLQEEHIILKDIEKRSLNERVQFFGQAYAKGATAIEGDEKAKEEITELNTKLFALSDGQTTEATIKNLYQKGKKWSLEYFEVIYKRLGTKFDFYYPESKVASFGVTLVKEGLEKGIFEKSQGAIVFPGEKYGLHTRVFINSQGLPTYEAKELGLAPAKYKDFLYDLSMVITANEVNDYFKVLLAVLKFLKPELAEKTVHIGHGMVRLPEGKMSSRTGNIITGESLLDEVKVRVMKIMDATENEVPQKEHEKIAEMIAQGAVKYSLLRVGVGKDIIFDFDKSLSLEGESGPYLQYTYTRCKSILRKAKLSLAKVRLNSVTFTPEETALLRLLYRFEEVVQEAAEKFSSNLVCTYVFDLAQRYNLFYNTNPVLKAETEEVKNFRLLLTASVGQVIKNSLLLLGIETPERM